MAWVCAQNDCEEFMGFHSILHHMLFFVNEKINLFTWYYMNNASFNNDWILKFDSNTVLFSITPKWMSDIDLKEVNEFQGNVFQGQCYVMYHLY